MAIDGRLLARARTALSGIRTANQHEQRRRLDKVYAELPRIREIDVKLKLLVINAASRALTSGVPAGVEIDKIAAESLELQAERAELLVAAGYSYNYTDERYNCPKCSDTGYVRAEPCTCLMKLYENEMTAELSSLLKLGEQTFETFNLRYYPDSSVDGDGSPREIMETVYETCRNYAYKFNANSMNLLFQGGTGLGKTFLSACIARVVSERGYSVVYDTAVSTLEAFENRKFRRDEQTENAGGEIRRYLDCDLLILDDLGTEMASAFTNSALYTLINSRLTSGKKTIISTNLNFSDLSRRYSPQIMSRLDGEYHILRFAGNDIRMVIKNLPWAD